MNSKGLNKFSIGPFSTIANNITTELALHNSQMSSGHSDLLTIDELPQNPVTLSRDIKGIVIVDHAVPLRKWATAKILSIFDHHQDSGAGPDAKPRTSSSAMID